MQFFTYLGSDLIMLLSKGYSSAETENLDYTQREDMQLMEGLTATGPV